MPVWHLGAAVGIPIVKDKLTANLYVYNGWNSIRDNNDGKTFGAQLKYLPTDSLTIINNFIGGPEKANDNGDWRVVDEMNITYAFNPKWAFVVEGLWGYESNALVGGEAGKWGGVTAHAKYTPCSKFWLSPRFEYYHDRSSYSLSGFSAAGGVGNRFTAETLTTGYALAEGLEARVEFRFDHAHDAKIFNTDSLNTSRNQFTTTGAILYSF
jgi:hypothetical protein